MKTLILLTVIALVACNPLALDKIPPHGSITGEWIHNDIYSYNNIVVDSFDVFINGFDENFHSGVLYSKSFKKPMNYEYYYGVLEIEISNYWHKWKR